jgi:hypothetical protein
MAADHFVQLYLSFHDFWSDYLTKRAAIENGVSHFGGVVQG